MGALKRYACSLIPVGMYAERFYLKGLDLEGKTVSLHGNIGQWLL